VRRGCLTGAGGLLLAALVTIWFLWWAPGPKPGPHDVMIPEGASLGSAARLLEKQGAIPGTARTYYVMARLFGSGDPIQAGEFAIPKGMGGAAILDLLQHGHPTQRLVTVVPGMPAIIVTERLATNPYLAGPLPPIAEGSVLPDSYGYQRGDSRAAIVRRMQAAMTGTLDALWAERSTDCPIATKEQAVTLASIAAWLFRLPVETIGSHFGQLPGGLPSPKLPSISYSTVLEVLPAAFSFTLLGAVESLLSAKVADGMTGRKHRYNMEVVAQGIANIASAIFGGISVTGTIARTATNIRAGACSPVSGMAHAVFVLMFMLTAAPLASFIPLSALAGVLVVVCWNMAEKEEFVRLLRDWRSACVLIATFGLTVIEDLTFEFVAGCALAAALALYDRVKRRRAEL